MEFCELSFRVRKLPGAHRAVYWETITSLASPNNLTESRPEPVSKYDAGTTVCYAERGEQREGSEASRTAS